jgi:hypothetical protein
MPAQPDAGSRSRLIGVTLEKLSAITARIAFAKSELQRNRQTAMVARPQRSGIGCG